ncbi:hypothetical protein C1645_755811 [Glomus cerebriforme]|uniref:MACPF domain-containing protein n=1 Tax=Glomus cerebriforme TaxID=658196 RepID=A0A397TGV0_9GLOM|nr:hypothetical protein C1645_755811 [Glomus cerebriforme]
MTFDGIKKANKRAFKMKYCDLNEIDAEGCRKGDIKFRSTKDWMMKTNLFFSTDINVQNFVELGMSIESSKSENVNIETNLSYQYIEYGKASLKFNEYLKPTSEFIKAVEDAIRSNDPREFRKITEEFGQFIPTEVIMGGRMYYTNMDLFAEHIATNSTAGDAEFMNANLGKAQGHTRGNSRQYNVSCTRLIGGEQPDGLENCDSKAWTQSLKDYTNWDCIEYRNPISIFSLLPENLRRKIFSSTGKRILYSKFVDYNYQLKERGKPKIFELKIPSNILDIIHNRDTDCSFFATVIDKEETNDFFNCQILCSANGKPSVIVHCIQRKFRKRECRLKIGLMIIGYDINFKFIFSDFNVQIGILKQNFEASSNIQLQNISDRENVSCLGIPVLNKLDSSNNSLIIGHFFFEEENAIGTRTFSYCLKKKYYVRLPTFTFYTLTISNFPNSNAFGTTTFGRQLLKGPCINTTTSKFISLYCTLYPTRRNNNFANLGNLANLSNLGNNPGPVLLKQNTKQITTYDINCKCKKKLRETCHTCRENLRFQRNINNIKCAFFDSNLF